MSSLMSISSKKKKMNIKGFGDFTQKFNILTIAKPFYWYLLMYVCINQMYGCINQMYGYMNEINGFIN